MQPENRSNPRIHHLAVLLTCIGFGVALGCFAYAGFFGRLWADDYCYEVSLRVHGFFAGQWFFYLGTSNRYSVIPFVGLNELLGQWSLRLWALEAVLLLMAGLYALLLQAGRRLWTLERVLLVVMVVFFTLWQAPNRFQVLYWRTGMLTYLMPLVFILFLASAILQLSRRDRLPGWLYPVVFLFAFFSAGFSETTAALQAGLLLLALALLYLARRSEFAPPRLFYLLIAAVAGTLAGMLVLIVSPATGLRMQNMPRSADALTLVSLSFRFAWDFLYDTAVTQPLPTLVSIFAPLAYGAAWAARREPDAGFGQLAVLVLGAAAATYLLVVASFAPSVFVQVAYPEPRALIPARLVMTSGLTALGWLFGQMAWNVARRIKLPGRAFSLAALAVMVILALYPLRSAGAILAEADYLQQRAQNWDQRDATIRSMASAGESSIRIAALDSMFGLMDLTDQPHLWPNNCIAGYYGLQSMTGFIP